ncbi:MAG: hypothetical protein LBV67_06620 [Streptococcaceae bacterium]|jgi:hypothetical protein|nr:hypothetical protein [Streptococcaceae bacterium]
MQINISEKIQDDRFFIGSYPSNFAVGRWFAVEELLMSTYGDIEEEYLESYNPAKYSELELGIFDVDNYSGLWEGEYEVSGLIKKLHTIFEMDDYDLEYEVYDFDDESVFSEIGYGVAETARAVYFGNIRSWTDPYLEIDGYGNFKSIDETEYQENIKMYLKDSGLFK